MIPLPSLLHVVERLPTPVVLTDEDGVVMAASAPAAELLGARPPALTVQLDGHLAGLQVPLTRTRATTIWADGRELRLVGLAGGPSPRPTPPDVATLAGEIAHDFNNLLGVILNFATLAAASTPAGTQAAQDLQEVLIASRRAAEITKQLSELSRSEGSVPGP